MSDSRTLVVLAGAAAVVLALWAPWYGLDLSGVAGERLGQQAGQLPGVIGEFARGLLSVLPEHIVANAWTCFDKADVFMLVGAVGAAFAALGNRLDIARIAGSATVFVVLGAMLVRRGQFSDLVTLQWGAYVALAGGFTIVGGASMRVRKAASSQPGAAPIDWSQVRVVDEPALKLGTGATSVAPPAESL